jgi:membrane protein
MLGLTDKIKQSSLANTLVKWAQNVYPPGFQRIPLYDVTKFFWGELMRGDLNLRASAISFNLVISIPAGLIFLFTIVPFLPIRVEFTNYLLKIIESYVPTSQAGNVSQFITEFLNTQRSTLTFLGLFIVAYATSSAMIGIMESFDQKIIDRKDRGFFKKRLSAIRLVALLLLLIIASVFLLISEGKLLNYILKWIDLDTSTVRTAVKILDWIVVILLSFFSIGCIYRYAPSIHKKWPIITPGSILATFLILLTTWLLSYWVNNFSNYNEIYGSLGTILVMMFLIYFNSLVLLIGFELNNSITKLKLEAQKRKEEEEEEEATA